METPDDLGTEKTLVEETGVAVVVDDAQVKGLGVEKKSEAKIGDGSVVGEGKVSGSANGADDSAEKIEVSGDCISLVVEVNGSSNGVVVEGSSRAVEAEVVALKGNGATDSEVREETERNGAEDGVLNRKGEDPVGEVSEIVEEMQVEGEEDQEHVFSVGDFVWGKVKGRPWWPGKIYNPSVASKSAVRYHRKDSFLVAFFGDDTFAWCNSSQLKPFFETFEEMSVQGTSVSFINAIEEAVEEVGRCVKSDMTCSCVPLGSQNMGIKGVEMDGDGIDKVFITQFEPTRFLQLLWDIAKVVSKIGRLELTVFRSQLSAFHRAKGENQLDVYPEAEEITGPEDDTGDGTKNEVSFGERTTDLNQLAPEAEWASSPLSPRFRKISAQNCGGISENKLYPRKKQRSMSDLLTMPSKKRMTSNDSQFASDSGFAEDDSGNHKSTIEKQKKGKRFGPITEVANIPEPDNELTVKNDDGSLESSKAGTVTRERKKSKYLSPPYTTIDRGNKSLFSFKDSEAEHLNIRKVSDITEDIGNTSGNSVSAINCSGEKLQKELDKNSEKRRKRYGSLSPRTPKEILKKVDLNVGDVVVEEIFVQFQCTALDPMYLKGKNCSETIRNFFAQFRSSMYQDESGNKPLDTNAVTSQPSEDNISLDFKHDSQEKDKHETDQPTSEGKSVPKKRKRKEEPKLQSTEGKESDDVGTPNVKADRNGGLNGVQETPEPDRPTSDDGSKPKKRGRKSKSEHTSGNSIMKADQPTSDDGSKPKKRGRKSKLESAGGNGIMKTDQPTVDDRSEPKKRGRKRKSECAGGNSVMKTDGPTLDDRSEPRKRGRKKKSESAGGNGIMNPTHKEKSKGKASSAALLLTFAPGVSLPSKDHLIEVFRKFGALNEVKSEVTKESSCVSIFYTRSSDAEEALKSSRKTSPLGPDVVSYRLQYLSTSSRDTEHGENPVQNVPPPTGGEAPPLDFIKQNLKMMTSMLEKSGDNLTPEVRANLEAEIHSLLKKVSTMVETPLS